MDRKEFEESVRAGRPPDLPEFMVEEATRYYTEELKKSGIFGYEDLATCIRLAGWLTRAAGGGASREIDRTWDEMRWSTDRLVMSEQMLDLIKSEVCAVRRKIFGSPDPPFTDYEEATLWLEREGKKSSAIRTGKRAYDCAYRDWITKGREFQKHTRSIVRCGLERRTITYVNPGDKWTRVLPVDRGTPLATFETLLRRATEYTGFSQPELVIHVLTPLHPTLPRWRLGQRLKAMSVLQPIGLITIDILAQNVTWKDFRDIYRRTNELLRRNKATLIDETDEILYGVVRRLGGVPPHGKMAFWEVVRKKCRRLGVISFKTAHAARVRYKRLQKKLETLRHHKPRKSVGRSKARAHA